MAGQRPEGSRQTWVVLPHLHGAPVRRKADGHDGDVSIGRNAYCSNKRGCREGGGQAPFDWTSQRMITESGGAIESKTFAARHQRQGGAITLLGMDHHPSEGVGDLVDCAPSNVRSRWHFSSRPIVRIEILEGGGIRVLGALAVHWGRCVPWRRG